MAPLLRPELDRRSRQGLDPVTDFLFEYYSFRPSLLARWTPGLHRYLADGDEYLTHPHFTSGTHGVGLYPGGVPTTRLSWFSRLLDILRSTQNRKPFFGCLGLHEWAMVYEESDIRHKQVPLRLSHDETRRVVESLPIRCSHYDAFRHFSKSARTYNQLSPAKDDRVDFEQPGCIHANMDVYKYAFKLYPWVPSELLADSFDLARAARAVDMRASPYDVRVLGLQPIPIEALEGQVEYREEQRFLAGRAGELRGRLINEIERLLELTETVGKGEDTPMTPAHP
jgi:hypothetical protein